MRIFKEIFNNKLRNLVNVDRYNGMHCSKPESVPNHNSDMFACAYSIVEILNRNCSDELLEGELDLKEITYKIMIHDLDEALICDIPRSLKYMTPEITKAIKKGVKDLMIREFSPVLVNDIDNSKGYHDLNSLIVKICDVLQARFKIYEEYFLLGNKSFLSQVISSEEYLLEIAAEIEDPISIGNLKPNTRATLVALIKECVEYTSDLTES